MNKHHEFYSSSMWKPSVPSASLFHHLRRLKGTKRWMCSHATDLSVYTKCSSYSSSRLQCWLPPAVHCTEYSGTTLRQCKTTSNNALFTLVNYRRQNRTDKSGQQKVFTIKSASIKST